MLRQKQKTTTKLTKTDINNAADLIALRGEIPTIEKIKAELHGRGSTTTIHNYLKEWKKIRLLSKPNQQLSNYQKELLLCEEQRNLQEILNKQIIQNEHYAQELINAEKANIVMKQNIHQLESTLQELNLKLSKETAVNINLNKAVNQIQQQLATNTNATIHQQKLLIDALQQEIKTLNAKSIEMIQELSSKNHEMLMQERIISINIQAKLDNVSKELLETQKQLEVTKLKAQVKNQELERQINWQQQLLTKFVEPEKLQALIYEQQSL